MIRTDALNKDFVTLVANLDADLKIRDGDEHDFYNQFNKTDTIKYVIVLYDGGQAVACGAFKEFEPETIELKRMFVLPANRRHGLASKVLGELENWATELGYKKCILETGVKQTEAIALYQKNNYNSMSNYGQYKNVENSLCFEKTLGKKKGQNFQRH